MSGKAPSIHRLMCANRGEIAIRVFRAATELGKHTISIFSHEDRVHLHRYKADEGYLVGRGKNPVQAYLDIEEIIAVAKRNRVDAIHPGYGFLSERADFARRCEEEGIIFIGPTSAVLEMFGNKLSARELAVACSVPVIPGSKKPVTDASAVLSFAEVHGFPLIIKAAMGGGGRGMRVLHDDQGVEKALQAASSEALATFGDGTVFLERYLEAPRHIEVQILADQHGNRMHLFERDCSVQRRHQKLVEMAPAMNLDEKLRERMFTDALKLAHRAKYTNAGTVEFLVDKEGRHFFIEVNPRLQVEHTVTEEVTGADIVQAQIRIAEGWSLEELGLDQNKLRPRGVAIQCRITTEDPTNDFAPDTGRIEVYRSGCGMGIRLDGGSGYAGAKISPHYDPLLVKVTGSGTDFESTYRKLHRCLLEFRIRGVKTNIPFLLKVLEHPRFQAGTLDTGFVDNTPELFRFPRRRNRAQKLLRFLGDLVVNGAQIQATSQQAPATVDPVPPTTSENTEAPKGWKQVLDVEGAKGFARKVREHKGLLVTDTTWRDAHQSLLATRVRSKDLLAVAPATSVVLAQAFSLEMWGGATFDVALRFLHECPWDRLDNLRCAVPNIPFQMLMRGANAVGYSSYPDNVVVQFIKQAKEHGIDVFRIFDSLNYLENLKLAIDTVGETGAVIEACLCYSGDVSDRERHKYDLDYYLDFAASLVEQGIHVLAIKDMAGLLKPRAATMLVEALREAFPELPIHIHSHDTAGNSVASMLAATEAGADIVDLALSSMAGLTSQPSMGAVVAALEGSERACDIDLSALQQLNAYWEQVRELYAPFESGLKSGSVDVYEHEMPGGQLTNLKFQSQALGLTGRWTAIKQAYGAANRLLGDVIKVTPTSKVVGDLAQFMVQNDLSESDVLEQADTLSFPTSLTDFMMGRLGQPYQGFPEPLRSKVLRGRTPIEGRPSASLPPLDFAALRCELEEKHTREIRDVDLLSSALYPEVFDSYLRFREQYSDVSVLPTRSFVAPLSIGEEIVFEIERGKTLVVKLETIGELDDRGERTVFFELNGQPRAIRIPDKKAKESVVTREAADPNNKGQVAAPMLGVVAELRVKPGQTVEKQDPLLVMTAMKMETIVTAPVAGKVVRIAVEANDSLQAGDLLLEIAPA